MLKRNGIHYKCPPFLTGLKHVHLSIGLQIFTEVGGLVGDQLVLEVTSCEDIRWLTHAPPPGLVDPSLGPLNPAKEIPMRLMRENAWPGWLD